jgi:adenosylcobyric acid synthase
LLPPAYRRLVRGFVINKLRGDPALLGSACADLEQRCGVPTLGVLPWIHDVALDAEDSLGLSGRRPRPATAPSTADVLDVAVVRFPRISNFTDLDALAIEPDVGVRFVEEAGALGDPDLVIFPGSKATVADLAWLRARGLDAAVARAAEAGAAVLGICGGYQLLGRTIDDAVESESGRVAGLGWLGVDTVFGPVKVTRQRRGFSTDGAHSRVEGYEIHHGVVQPSSDGPRPWIQLDDAYGTGVAGIETGGVFGTSLHGIFEADAFRSAFLAKIAGRRGKSFTPAGVSFAAAREAQFDRLADLLEAHLDLVVLDKLIAEGVPS